VLRLLTFLIYAWIMLLVFDIDEYCKSGCSEQDQRRLIMRQFDLLLHPIMWFTVISDLLLQNDRDVI
jgi:hypothetical protein